MRIAYWIIKAKNTHSEYVIHIDFPQQQYLRSAPQCYVYTYIHTHIACLHNACWRRRVIILFCWPCIPV